jgi:hypothetical protein
MIIYIKIILKRRVLIISCIEEKMFTRAIVDSVVDKYHIRVRIPLLDRVASTNVHTSSDDLNIATICTLPNCSPNIKPGDVVFVAFESTDVGKKAVVVGYLFREAMAQTYCDMVVDDLQVVGKCTLPYETSIGGVSQNELANLRGVRDNLQRQIDSLLERVIELENSILKLTDTKEVV